MKNLITFGAKYLVDDENQFFKVQTRQNAFLIAFFSVLNFISAQQIIPLQENKFLDSLNLSLKSKIPDSAKANSYLLLSDYYRTPNPEKARQYLSLSEKFVGKNSTAKAKFHFYSGMLLSTENPGKAAEHFEQAKSILKHKKDPVSLTFLSSVYYNAALLEQNKEGYPYIMKTLTETSIPLAEKSGDQRKIGHLYAQLGNILTYNAEFPKAETYLAKARETLQKAAPNSAEMLIAYLNSCMNFCYQDKRKQAKEMLDKAENLIKNYPESANYPLFLYNKMLYEITIQNVPEALKTADLGIQKSSAKRQKFLLQMFYFNKYDLLRKSGKFAEAKQILLNILSDKTLVNDAANRKTVYSQLSSLSEEMGDTKDALLWSRQYSKISDSLNDSKMKLEINNLEAKYRTTEKERQLAEKNLQISRKNSLMWLFVGTSALFLLAGIFAYFYFRNKKKLTEQREIILAQKLVEKEKTEELVVTKAILDGEERERQRVAKDLHDGLGGMLAGVKINLSSWGANNLENAQAQDFHKILNQLDGSVSELRRVARNLMPESLLNFGLEVALQDLCEFYSRPDMEVDFQPLGIEKNLPLQFQINTYRIVQELLSNAVKHSGARKIFVQCAQSGSNFQITIEDDGVGMSAEDFQKMKSMGLKNVQNRVNFLKGSIDFQTQKDQGTTINIDLDTDAA